MTERPACSVDFRRIIGAVHEIVEIGHTLRLFNVKPNTGDP
jgi:hypothetical protein